ncbi:MAG: hypothetical protein K1X44_05940 [Alphaproteobacteria bacterium]|nr:hypothetical protein [Alphaproteobacteria bacterium]
MNISYQNNRDILLYMNHIEKIREKLLFIYDVLTNKISLQSETYNNEIIALQFRKILELIAFSSLIANKEKYSYAYEKWYMHYKSKSILKCIEELNPQFYPDPGVLENDPFTKLFIFKSKKWANDYLTQDDFEELYDYCSEILHIKNPFNTKSHGQKYSWTEWSDRILRLLHSYWLELPDTTDSWLVSMLKNEPVQVVYLGKKTN